MAPNISEKDVANGWFPAIIILENKKLSHKLYNRYTIPVLSTGKLHTRGSLKARKVNPRLCRELYGIRRNGFQVFNDRPRAYNREQVTHPPRLKPNWTQRKKRQAQANQPPPNPFKYPTPTAARIPPPPRYNNIQQAATQTGILYVPGKRYIPHYLARAGRRHLSVETKLTTGSKLEHPQGLFPRL